MSEKNGKTPEVGDMIVVNTQVARLESYTEDSNWMSWVVTSGQGVDFRSGHISNTDFEIIDPVNHDSLASEQADVLNAHLETVSFITEPVEEDPDTDRVKGEPGAKMAGNPDNASGDEFTQLG